MFDFHFELSTFQTILGIFFSLIAGIGWIIQVTDEVHWHWITKTIAYTLVTLIFSILGFLLGIAIYYFLIAVAVLIILVFLVIVFKKK